MDAERGVQAILSNIDIFIRWKIDAAIGITKYRLFGCLSCPSLKDKHRCHLIFLFNTRGIKREPSISSRLRAIHMNT